MWESMKNRLLLAAILTASFASQAAEFEYRIYSKGLRAPGAGTVPSSTLSVSPASHNFGGVSVASPASQSFTVTNTGTTAENLSFGALAPPFSVSHDCPSALNKGESCTATVTYTPSTTTASESTLEVAGNASSTSISLSGTGVLVSATWKTVEVTRENWYAVTYLNGQFLAPVINGLYKSEDGRAWRYSAYGPATISDSQPLAVEYGNGRYVAIGGRGTLATSEDGESWWLGTAPFGVNSSYTHLAFGAGKFVSVQSGSYGAITYSQDGQSWTTSTTYKSWGSVVYGNGKFVAASAVGSPPLTSFDAITWTQGTKGMTGKISFTNGKFFIVGTNTIWVSEDGVSWTATSLPVTISISYSVKVAYGGGRYMLAAPSGIFTSTDGSTWTQLPTPAGTWTTVSYGNGRFVAGSVNGRNLAYTD
jgi:hypothetical protein